MADKKTEKNKISTYGKSASFYTFRNGKKEYFMKRSKNVALLKKEYDNAKKLNRNVRIKGLRFLKPVSFDAKKGEYVTELESGKQLLDVHSQKKYEQFGRLLRKFHDKGYSLEHLKFNDVIVSGEWFVLTDLGRLNTADRYSDLANLALNLNLFKITRPLKRIIYSDLFLSFAFGYGKFDNQKLLDAYNKIRKERLGKFFKGSIGSKAKGVILLIASKIGLL